MTIIKSTSSVLILLLFSIIIGVSVQAQQQTNRNNTRQVGNMLQRLERSSSRFRKSLNVALVQVSVDQTQPQNDISTFQAGLNLAIKQFRDQFTRRLAVGSDVESILQKASPINSFINQNTLNSRVKNDWTSVRTDLNTLASAYGVGWQWNQLSPMKVDSNRSFRLSESELNLLIQQLENGGDAFRVSLTDAFFRRPSDRTRSEGNMNDALRSFKKATDEVRIRFDARQMVSADVQRLLDQAQPLDKFMRENPLTDRARDDWSTLRANLSLLANAYNVAPSWINNSSSQTGYKGANRLTGTFRLDSSRSDNPREKAQRATQNLRTDERQEVADQILARLESPEMLMIERRGTTITIASSLAPQSTFEADGRERQEQLPNGRSTRVTVTLRGEQLVVDSNGYKANDFNVTFDATENDNTLRVRRQIYSDRLTQPVVVDSVYDRTADVAEWNVNNRPRPGVSITGAIPSEFIVQDGETVLAVLSTTAQVQNQDDRYVRERDNVNQNSRGREWDLYANYGGSLELRRTALNAGYDEGIKEGRKDRGNGSRTEHRNLRSYREATKDYSRHLGDRKLYRRYFQEAFEEGYNAESYARGNRNRWERNDNGNQDRSGRNEDGYGNFGGSFQLRQTALNAGFGEGVKQGREDRRKRNGNGYQSQSTYQKATKDYSSNLGDREVFQRYFREAYEHGYADGYAGY